MVEKTASPAIAVVIPAYRVKAHIAAVLGAIGPEVSLIVVVDDACPEGSGRFVQQHCPDPRIVVLFNERNIGVGGAVMRGYREALARKADVIVKIDGDGQMDPGLIPAFIAPIVDGEADYTKGNRFFEVETVQQMPLLRLVGNIGLSFLTKASSGYWNLFDPTNGYTAIHARVAALLPAEKMEKRYFFESDMLLRLNTLRAVGVDIPMYARYADAVSTLTAAREFFVFLALNLRNLLKRLSYNYLLRNFNFATIELLAGVAFLLFGMAFGSRAWIHGMMTGTYASAGTVMLAGLSTLVGLQLLLGFINFDMTNIPASPLHKRLHADARRPPA
jgi:glycosyltransferase involved in cell wall biosynthesis